MYFRKKVVLLQPNCGTLRKLSLILLLFLLLLPPSVLAEVVTLRTGKVVTGEIILQNEEVLIIRTKNGDRYQYPAVEILSVKSEKTALNDTLVASSKLRKVVVRLQTSGGAVYMPEIGWGGQFAFDLMLGTRKIQDTRIFLAAGLGYRAKAFASEHAEQTKHVTYSFMPLQAVVAMPLGGREHAPVLGVSFGYGFALNKQTQGGICVGAEFGWSYAISEVVDLQLALVAELQQAKIDVRQIVNDLEYINHMGCNFATLGVKLAVNL